MPTYEFLCPQGHRFEKFFPTFTDKKRAPCPTCGKRAERLISGGAGLVFKGSGFYITDYKRAGDKKPEPGEKAAKPDKAAEGKATDSTTKPDKPKSDK